MRRRRRKQALNAHRRRGRPALVLVIVLVTKFAQGAWIVVLAAPLLFVAMKAIAAHYRHVAEQLAPTASGVALPGRVHAVVLVSNLLAPTLRALAFARATAPATLVAVTVTDDADDPLAREWRGARRAGRPRACWSRRTARSCARCVRYVRQLRREHPGDVISIVVPEYVVAHWWEHVLHNQTALRLKARLRFEPGVTVTSVPWLLARSRRTVPVSRDEHQQPHRARPSGGSPRRRRAEPAAARGSR